MGLEVATYINELNVNWPVATDKIREGDDHLRVIKTALVNSFPHIGGPVMLDETQLNLLPDYLEAFVAHLFPVGGIIAWSGAANAIPAGWALCNGANGTPDLRNRFIIGAGDTYAVGATGGAASANTSSVSAGTITIGGTALSIAQIPSLSFFVATDSGTSNDTTVTSTTSVDVSTPYGGDSNYRLRQKSGTPNVGRTNSLGGGSTHTHTATQGSHAHTVETLPPYYALCWIMKTLAWEEPS